MTEFELKFAIPATARQRIAAALSTGKTLRQRLRAVYFDTADGALARHGLVVRLRKEGRRWVQTAKGPTSSPLERLEYNVTLASTKAGAMPVVDLALHAATPLGAALNKALHLKAGDVPPQLTAMYETDIQRITRIAEQDGSLIELALDRGHVLANGQSSAICELEIELKQGLPEHAVGLARQWCAEYGLSLSSITKSMKGQRLRGGHTTHTAVTAVAPQFERDATDAQIVRAVFDSCLLQILPNASELSAGSGDPDQVHQLRVGIRRLRTALRELRDLSGGFDPNWETALVDVFRQLGRSRDHHQLARTLQPKLEAAGGPSLTFGLATEDDVDLGRVVRTPAFQDGLLCLIGFTPRAPAPAEHDNSMRRSAKKALSLRLGKLYLQVVKDGKRFLSLSDEQQHRLRKRLKRLRYLVEFSAPLFSHRKTKKFITAIKPAQEALGLHLDERLALNAFQLLAVENEHALFGVGWLTARRLPQAKRCRKEMKALAKAHPFWG
jgi:triphosphatase